jgi:hypothetical protein
MTIHPPQAGSRTLTCVFGGLLLSGIAFGQAAPSPVAASSPAAASSVSDSTQQATVQTYQQEQMALAQEEAALVAQGATQTQIDAWQQQNAARFDAQLGRAQAMAAASAAQTKPVTIQPNIPADASPTLRDFLTTQATLSNAHAQLHGQLMQTLPASATNDRLNQKQQNEEQLFQQQHAGELKLQAQRGQLLAQESTQKATPMPPPLQIPPGATPQMTAFLTLKDQLMREEIQVSNQTVTSDVQTKVTAIQQWHQANAARFQQLQQLGQQLNPLTTTTTPGGTNR